MATISPTEYETRIHALEKLNATLAAEIDRMRPVVEAAQKAVAPELIHASLLDLLEAVMIYEGDSNA